MKKKKTVKQRNFIARDLCTNRQFRNKVHVNKKKKIKKFNLGCELRKYKARTMRAFLSYINRGHAASF